MSYCVQATGKTDVGSVRTNNEDNFGFDIRCGIYVVCDGMGGAAAGEVASKMSVDAMLTYFREARSKGEFPQLGEPLEGMSPRANALLSSIRLANTAVYETGSRSPSKQGMGSTIVCVLVEGSFFSIAHVGDSRIYLLRNGEIQQLTVDHSYVMEQVRKGMITLEEAARSEYQNIISRALGTSEAVEPDIDEMVAFPGDMLLLASDGLTKLVSDQAMRDIIQAAPTLEQACDDLIQRAKDMGGDDNITCLLLRFVEQPWYRSWFNRIFGGGTQQWQSST
jgi:serine/threonine protein phosphatase PrpC